MHEETGRTAKPAIFALRKPVLIAIIILSLAGVADAGYSLEQHYAPPFSSSCDVNETISCTAVNQSEYSEFAGIPVAGIGLAGYIFFAAMAIVLLLRSQAPRLVLPAMRLAALVALAVSLLLTYIEIFVLRAVCPLCVISLTLVLIITLLLFADVFWRLGGRRG